MRRSDGGARCGACGWSSQDQLREARVTVRPDYAGLPFSGLVGDGGRAAKADSIPRWKAHPSVAESYGPEEPKIAAVERRQAAVLR